MNIQTVFENENFIVVDKASMVLSTPSREGVKDARPCLGITLQEQLGLQIYPVHRLDFEVSGLVLFAKTAKAHSQANTWFEKKLVRKTYQALSEVKPETAVPVAGERLLWKSKLLRGKRRSYEHELGKHSETEAVYRGLLKSSELAAHCWELHPLTGRPHQLRYELSRHGFPILGDALYGARTAYFGIALRAIEIDFKEATEAHGFGLPEVITVAGLKEVLSKPHLS